MDNYVMKRSALATLAAAAFQEQRLGRTRYYPPEGLPFAAAGHDTTDLDRLLDALRTSDALETLYQALRD